MKDFEDARQKMIEEQLIKRGIQNPRVLQAMGKVPRHLFVDKSLADKAYEDTPLPIGFSQTISQPYMVAIMTELLDLKGEEKVLEVGTGSGYQAAVLAELCRLVISIERHAELAEQAQKKLQELGYTNIEIKVGDGTLGWPEQAPYDGIVVTAGAPEIPPELIKQLVEGGRMTIPVGDVTHQELLLVTKHKEGYNSKAICGCIFVPLIGKEGWEP